MDRLEELGVRVREEQDTLLAEADHLHRVRQRLLARPRARPARRFLALGFATASMAAVAAAIFLFFRPTAETPLTYRVDGQARADGAWVSSPEDREVAVDFSDGSALRLAGDTDLRVVATEASGARVQLERGRASASIVHREATRWTFEAGPFTVLVIGTAFDLAWEPDEQTFALEMREGTVELRGPIVLTRRVRAGEVIRVSLRNESAAIDQSAALLESEVPLASAGDSDEVASTDRAVDVRARRSHVEERESTIDPPSVEALLNEGSYEEAVALALEEGWNETLDRLAASPLFSLGDAARLSGRPDLAVEAYTRLRARFPSGSTASRAAFMLGRIAQDQLHHSRDAARWFETYLDEAPSGPFAREAAGRLIEARRGAGDPAGARAAARAYLDTYPEGPHAALAESLVEPTR